MVSFIHLFKPFVWRDKKLATAAFPFISQNNERANAAVLEAADFIFTPGTFYRTKSHGLRRHLFSYKITGESVATWKFEVDAGTSPSADSSANKDNDRSIRINPNHFRHGTFLHAESRFWVIKSAEQFRRWINRRSSPSVDS